MLKKIAITFIVVFALLAGALRAMSISIFAIDEALDVSTHFGAKFACSATFITGLSEQQIMSDLVAYSPANAMLELVIENEQVTADFWGMSQATARFRRGLGCTLQHPDNRPVLDQLMVEPLPHSTADWPAGDLVATHRPEIQELVEQLMDQDNQAGLDTRALLVVSAGQIVAEHYAPGFDADTAFIGWSMGKSVTAMMLGHLAMQGKLDVNTQGLFQSWQEDSRRDISVSDLLSMTSGLAFDERYIPGADATRMLFLQPSISRFSAAQPQVHPRGTQFNYSSGTTNLLMGYMNRVLGGHPQQLVDYFYRDFAPALGLQRATFEVDGDGIFVGSSYVFATARDWARLGWAMANHGEINHGQILDEYWLQQATAPNSSSNEKSFGYQFWLNSGDGALRWPGLPTDTFAMQGSKKQRVMIFPQRKVVIVRLGWSRTYPDDKNFAAILSALD